VKVAQSKVDLPTKLPAKSVLIGPSSPIVKTYSLKQSRPFPPTVQFLSTKKFPVSPNVNPTPKVASSVGFIPSKVFLSDLLAGTNKVGGTASFAATKHPGASSVVGKSIPIQPTAKIHPTKLVGTNEFVKGSGSLIRSSPFQVTALVAS
jgi:hypothetical protein